MSIFRVGQRVRKVSLDRSYLSEARRNKVPVGAEGVVMGHATHKGEAFNLVAYPGYVVTHCVEVFGPYFWNSNHQLVPLTDPYTDAFIAKVKSWKPLAAKERA